MTQKALKLALEALERSVATCFDQYAHQQVMSQPDHFINQAITAIKEALAQPLQKPYDQTALELCNVCGWKTLIPDDCCLNCERAQPAQEPSE